MRRLLYFLFLLPLAAIAQEGADDQDVLKPIHDFIEGTTYNYPEKIVESFIPGGQMFLHNLADTLMIWPVERYAALYDNGRRGEQNQRFSKLLSLEVVENVAYAKLEVDIPSFSMRFYDLLLLKKVEGRWKIVSKCSTAIPLPLTPEQAKPKPEKEVVMEGLKRPWSMAFLSEKEVLIAEKDGGLIQANLDSGERREVGNLPNDIARAILIDTAKHVFGTFPSDAHGSTLAYNAGLFQVLLDPGFEENNKVYLSYAAEDKEKASALKVVRAELVDGSLQKIETLLEVGPYSHGLFHYGGGMVIGNDGKLYISTGERNLYEENNPVLPLSQDITDKRGKIFRLNLDGSIPGDNPDFGTSAVAGLYGLGIRAAQGITIHPRTGNLWFSEHGTIQGDEVNKLIPGANYGWPYQTTGRYRSKGYNPPMQNEISFTDPIYSWPQTIAPTGLTFYFGREFPQWHGSLIVPGLSRGNLIRLELENERVVATEELFVDDKVRLRKAIVSPRGHLYVLTDEANGKLIKIMNAE